MKSRVFIAVSMVLVALLAMSCAKPRRDALAGKRFVCPADTTADIRVRGNDIAAVMGFSDEGHFIMGFLLTYAGDYEMVEREDGLYDVHFVNTMEKDVTEELGNITYDPETGKLAIHDDNGDFSGSFIWIDGIHKGPLSSHMDELK